MYNYDQTDQPETDPKPARKAAQPLTFGMTRGQLIILGVLALFACLSVGGMIALIASTPTVRKPTDTPVPTFALPVHVTPSATPEPGTATPEPTPTSIAPMAPPAGWINFSSNGVSLYLPPEFIGGDAKDQRSETVNRINNMGKPYNSLSKDVQAAAPELVLFAVQKEEAAPAVITTMWAFADMYPPDYSLEDYLNQDIFKLSSSGMVTEKKKMTILGHEALRVVMQTRSGGWDVVTVWYAIKDDIYFWRIIYTSSLNDYFTKQDIFTRSIGTLNLTRP
jgi:hypothetical protein